MYNAIVSCAYGWGQTLVENGADPERLGASLIHIIRRDGVEDASQQLCEYLMWSVINEDADHSPDWLWPENENGWDTVIVDGYGLAYELDRAQRHSRGDYEFGILTDGTLSIFHAPSGAEVHIDAFADGAFDKLEAFERELEEYE